jgi:hypothetical protein
MQSRYLNRLTFFLIVIILFLEACSSKVSKLPYQQPVSYLSPKYEDKSFNNVSMDICYPKADYEYGKSDYKYNSSLDSAIISMLSEFQSSFLKYFPDGIKMFSSINQTKWIFFNINHSGDFIEYKALNKDSSVYNIILPDSLIHFQRERNADFLFILHNSTITLKEPDSANLKSRYETILYSDYSIWDRKTSDLVVKDTLTTRMQFDHLPGKWPYRGTVMKTAALIFERLPMFQK